MTRRWEARVAHRKAKEVNYGKDMVQATRLEAATRVQGPVPSKSLFLDDPQWTPLSDLTGYDSAAIRRRLGAEPQVTAV